MTKKQPKAAKVAEKETAKAPSALPLGSLHPDELVKHLECPGVKLDRFAAGSKAYAQAVYLAGQLESEGPVRMVLQLKDKEKKGVAFETVIVNSLRFNILKGVFVNLPADIAKVLEDAFYATNAALNDVKVVNPVTGAVNPGRIDQRSDSDQAVLT